MTHLDSKAAVVALGVTWTQRVDFGPSGDGQYRATSDDGWIRIAHQNHSWTNDEVIYKGTLGLCEEGATVS